MVLTTIIYVGCRDAGYSRRSGNRRERAFEEVNRRRVEAEQERVEVARLRKEHARVLGDDDQGAEMAEPVKEEEEEDVLDLALPASIWNPEDIEDMGEPIYVPRVPSPPVVPRPVHYNVPHLQRLPPFPVMSWEEKEENRWVNIQRYHVAAYDLYRQLEEENARCTRAWEQGLVEAMAKP